MFCLEAVGGRLWSRDGIGGRLRSIATKGRSKPSSIDFIIISSLLRDRFDMKEMKTRHRYHAQRCVNLKCYSLMLSFQPVERSWDG